MLKKIPTVKRKVKTAKSLSASIKLGPTAKTVSKTSWLDRWYPRILLVLAVIGFVASFVLTLEKIAIIKNPQHHLSCSINPLLSCGPIITSPQASAFGFPNPIIGLFAFSVLICVAITMMAGAVVDKTKQWYWRLFVAGHLFGLGFVLWLIHEAVFELKALCIYCMVAWAVTFALNWYGYLWLSSTGRLVVTGVGRQLRDWGLRNHLGVLFLSYLAVFAVILLQFRDYFESFLH